MVNYPLLPPRPARQRIPRQFSISAIIVFTTVVAVAVSLFKEDGIGILLIADGGLFVIMGLLAAMLTLVGIAFALSKLPAPTVAAVCITTLIGLALASFGVAANWYDVREEIHGLLGPSLKKQKHVDLVVFWSCVSAASIALGTVLGYGIVLSRDRN